MQRKLVKQFHGAGKVYKEDVFLFQSNYAIKVYQDFPAPDVPGLQELVGRLTVDPHGMFGIVGQKLTLELADGGRFEFFFTNSSGKIAYMGGMRDASGKAV